MHSEMVNCSINVDYNLLVDSIAELMYIRSDFCLVVLTVVEREVLKAHTIVVDLPIAPFSSISFHFTYFLVVLFNA